MHPSMHDGHRTRFTTGCICRDMEQLVVFGVHLNSVMHFFCAREIVLLTDDSAACMQAGIETAKAEREQKESVISGKSRTCSSNHSFL
jgi:hypothetical protein